jgi:hypothetical protein
MESVVTLLLIARWQQVHDDMIGDTAWIAIFRDDHKELWRMQAQVDDDRIRRAGPALG